MSNKLKLGIIIGSVREGRFSEKTANFVADIAKKNEAFEVEVIDLKDWKFPFFDRAISPLMVTDGNYGNELTNAWSKKIASLDAYIFVTPEYNHGYSAVLKNAIDQISREWNHKAVGFVSHGAVAGVRAVEQLRLVVVNLGMIGVNSAVHINGAGWSLLDERGALIPGAFDHYIKPAEGMLEDILWWGNALKTARNA